MVAGFHRGPDLADLGDQGVLPRSMVQHRIKERKSDLALIIRNEPFESRKGRKLRCRKRAMMTKIPSIALPRPYLFA